VSLVFLGVLLGLVSSIAWKAAAAPAIRRLWRRVERRRRPPPPSRINLASFDALIKEQASSCSAADIDAKEAEVSRALDTLLQAPPVPLSTLIPPSLPQCRPGDHRGALSELESYPPVMTCAACGGRWIVDPFPGSTA